MNRSESITTLAPALVKAQGGMNGATKGKTNPHFKSKYADLESVMDAIKPSLAANDLSFVQVGHDSEGAAVIETIILHSSGEWLSAGVTAVPVSKADAQGYGSALTYARRYSLMSAFGVAPEDDDGNAAAKAPPQWQEKAVPPYEPPISARGGRIALDTFEKFDADSQNEFRNEAMEIIALFTKGDERGTFEYYQDVKKRLGPDEQVAVWSQLDSKVRSCIKRVGQVALQTHV